MDKELSILAVSDVHIGCPRLDPVKLHERFVKYLYPLVTKDISILFICGDFFDTLLNMNSLASLEAIEIIRELKRLCRENECDLRILRGTFTHDRNQPQHFINGEDPNDRTVMLFDKMSVEVNEKTGLKILYIPDNLSTNDIYGDIRKLLETHGLETVDIMVHHGYFEHMLPPALRGKTHGALDADTVGKFVKGCVLNGHVHLTSIYKNVISIGSFDRLTHGEEESKGFYKVTIATDGRYHFNFIENKEANKFYTFDMRTFGNMGSDAIAFFTKKWTEMITKFAPKESVRVRFMSDDPAIVEGCSQVAKELWPDVGIDKATVVKREQILENVNMGLEELPIITPANLEELLLPIVQKRSPNISPQDIHEVIESCTTN